MRENVSRQAISALLLQQQLIMQLSPPHTRTHSPNLGSSQEQQRFGMIISRPRSSLPRRSLPPATTTKSNTTNNYASDNTLTPLTATSSREVIPTIMNSQSLSSTNAGSILGTRVPQVQCVSTSYPTKDGTRLCWNSAIKPNSVTNNALPSDMPPGTVQNTNYNHSLASALTFSPAVSFGYPFMYIPPSDFTRQLAPSYPCISSYPSQQDLQLDIQPVPQLYARRDNAMLEDNMCTTAGRTILTSHDAKILYN